MTEKELVTGFEKGEIRSLTRLISWAENRDPKILPILLQLRKRSANARVLGLTGAPGAGKSTLVGQLIERLRKKNLKVAVVAVDPISPFTGGALLGDRIRLTSHFNDPGVFIRSLSTRGKLGGLSLASREVVQLLSLFGFDYVLLETVGVGQSEVDVRKIADLTAVALVPEGGDAVQLMKAGVLEIGDLFIVNKSDREGADKLNVELKSMVELSNKTTPVVQTNQNDSATYDSLLATVEKEFEDKKTLIASRRQEGKKEAATNLIADYLSKEASHYIEGVWSEDKDPYQLFSEFLSQHPPGSVLK